LSIIVKDGQRGNGDVTFIRHNYQKGGDEAGTRLGLLNRVKELEIIYRAAEINGIPIMFHTGTSIFPALVIGTVIRFSSTMWPSIFRN
jgi:predicted TIM-barrel fold metal-dependent hydrolase